MCAHYEFSVVRENYSQGLIFQNFEATFDWWAVSYFTQVQTFVKLSTEHIWAGFEVDI